MRLVEVARAAGCPRATLVQNAASMDWRALDGVTTVAMSAGASAPEELVDAEATEAAQAANATYLSLLANADAEAAGAVVVAPRSSDAEDGLLSEVRADADLTEVLSSVDNLGTPGGRLSVVLALREQAEGRAGQYGTGESAQSAAPAYTAPTPQETPGEEPTDTSTGDG